MKKFLTLVSLAFFWITGCSDCLNPVAPQPLNESVPGISAGPLSHAGDSGTHRPFVE